MREPPERAVVVTVVSYFQILVVALQNIVKNQQLSQKVKFCFNDQLLQSERLTR